ncbi:hypothetical protein IMSHALPRED_008506 [Imshaugia aleurites]|uniref:Vacuolar import and degradation protein n=1 Tax=Imshaugia aleurites TaxID=172621 RepID=A0A8H3ENU3_9LECA|nr:hypothetical protein IMSHALPRED_008506 [Imshaugia aleurites]
MPTPRDSTDQLPLLLERSTHTTCPPEEDRPGQWRVEVLDRLGRAALESAISNQALGQRDEVPVEAESPNTMEIAIDQGQDRTSDHVNTMDLAEASLLGESPSSLHADEKEVEQIQPSVSTSSALDLYYSIRFGIESNRLIQTHTSSMLRAGSKFRGTQQSDSQKYTVEVDIKTVDMCESFICGYLKIEGLTPEHATLTTFFEGEIIGPKYTFQTRHEDWGASDKEDMKHWARFPAWRPLAKQAKKPDFHYKNSTNRENMFMRWKEKFLVPDHRVREISGASFEGFYYICFNQVAGTINGIYFHSSNSQHNNNNNRFQQLELKWVNDRGCFGAMEFR